MEIEMHVEMAILAGLLPKCDLCQWEFNLVERVPFTMSCCHSLCWSCLGEVLRSRRERKRFRRRTRMKCPICARKPVKYLLNHCVLGSIFSFPQRFCKNENIELAGLCYPFFFADFFCQNLKINI